MKMMTGNTMKYIFKQMDAVGLLPFEVRRIALIVLQSNKGHVTIVPTPTFDDYWNIF